MPAFSAGIALIIIITLFWDICVIQFNPAVTVSLVMAEILPFRLMIPNIIGIGYKSRHDSWLIYLLWGIISHNISIICFNAWLITLWSTSKMIVIAQSSTMRWHPCSIHSSSTSWISGWSYSHFRRVKHLVDFHCWNNFDICNELRHRCSIIGWQV